MHVCVALGKSLEEMTLNWDPNNQKEASGEIWAKNTLGVATKGLKSRKRRQWSWGGNWPTCSQVSWGLGGCHSTETPLVLWYSETHRHIQRQAKLHMYPTYMFPPKSSVPSRILPLKETSRLQARGSDIGTIERRKSVKSFLGNCIMAKTRSSQCKGLWVWSLFRELDPTCHN